MLCNEFSIRVNNLNKKFRKSVSTKDKIKQLVSLLADKHDNYDDKEAFYALRDVSFDILKGDTVGIVGKNGSGKSTLLQIICGTLTESSGAIQVNGRIAALLELGSGFNPEFTGRENVFMNAKILGLTKDEIQEKFDDIVSFAEIGDFIDQPVKSYSSGMLVRLAFSVAISIEPEILVVDEALAVGDELFQRKCFSRIENLKKQGVTVLFVSHDAKAVVELCDKAILLNSGEVLGIGTPKKIIGYYQKLLYTPIEQQENIKEEIKEIFSNTSNLKELTEEVVDTELPDDLDVFDPYLKPLTTISYERLGAEIISLRTLNQQGERSNIFITGNRYKYQFDVKFDKTLLNVRFGMVVKSSTGFPIGGMLSQASKNAISEVALGSIITVEFELDCLLTTGTYFLNAGVYSDDGETEVIVHRIVDAAVFRVAPNSESLVTELIDFNFTSGYKINE